MQINDIYILYFFKGNDILKCTCGLSTFLYYSQNVSNF